MPSSRTLILKGILGIAGLGVTGAGGIGLGLGKTFSEGQKDQTSKDSSTKPGEAGRIVTVEDADLGIPKECDKTCVLTAEQLEKLKFEKSGNEEITFEGLDKSDEFELTIEDSEDLTNYPKGKKYTLKPKTISGPVTIKNVKEGDIVLENSKEILIREISSGGKLEHLLEEITELGIPKRCVSDQATTECELTQLQLQKLKFETREKEKITVDGLNEGNIVTLKVEDKGDDRDNYPKGKKYTLRSESGEVTIKGVKEEDIVLGAGKDVLIRETSSGGKLEHLLEEVDRLGIPRRCNADEVSPKPCPLIKKQLKDLKFEPKEGSSITVDGKDGNSEFILEIEDKSNELTNYPKGKKYSLKSTGTKATIQNIKGGDIHIWKNQEVVIREKEEGGKFEMAPEEVDELGIPKSCAPGKTCHLTTQQLKNLQFEKSGEEEITLQPEISKLELTIENRNDRENYPKGKKYTLTSKNEKVTIKGLNGEDITIGKKGIVIREKENERKLEKAPEEIDDLGIPSRCNSGVKCHLTREELQRIKFETKGAPSISIDGLNDGSTVDLKVETAGNVSDYPGGKKYILTSTSGTVTIQNTKDRNIVLEGNKGVVFRKTKDQNKLETYLDVLGIPRPWGAEEIKKASGPKAYCLSSDKLKDLRFENFSEKTGEVEVKGLKGTEKIELTISWDGDKSKYPDNRKFSFDNISKNEDITITKGDQTVTIAKHKVTWFGNDNGQLVLVEIKDKGQIERERKLAELKGILEKLGLGGLSIGDLVEGSSIKRKQTSIEFKKNDNESDLKKIQFKALGGGATDVTSLGHWGIKVFLDWEENTGKFPNNMKFSFYNPSDYVSGFQLKKGRNSVTIPQRSVGTPMPTFKAVEEKGKWYLVKVS